MRRFPNRQRARSILAYRVMPGNTSDKKTLLEFMANIEGQYGRSDRVWIMDWGFPTEESLEAMWSDPSGIRYLVIGRRSGRVEMSFSSIELDLYNP